MNRNLILTFIFILFCMAAAPVIGAPGYYEQLDLITANADLWKELAVLTATHQVTFSKVKGHADDELNNRCDELAVAESRKFK